MAMIDSRIENGIAVLEINRPPVNSYTTELLKELDAAILDARFNDDIHAIIITGKVEKFSPPAPTSICYRASRSVQKQLRAARP